jgi:hypothetical protein
MNKRKIQFERRHFLQMVGASALTYPFLRGLPSYAAASGTAPTYFVPIFTPCGCVRPLWGATDGSGTDVPRPMLGSQPVVTSNFVFRNTLTPFASGGTVGGTTWTTNLQNKVIILDGINNRAAAGGSHEAGMATLWTGQIFNGNQATSISIDQQIAGDLKAGTPFSTVQLMVRDPADFPDREVKTRMLYTAAGVFVDPIDNPTAARQILFPSSTTAGGPDKTTFIRQQLFGGGKGELNTELNALLPRLCTQDRAQLQALQDGWNMLDAQLTAAAAAAARCTAPDMAAATTDFPTNAKLQMDLLALAIGCDLTRVASLQFSTATSQVTHSWLTSSAVPQMKTHHDYSHNGPGSLFSIAGCTMYNNAGQCSYSPNIYSASPSLYTDGTTVTFNQQKAIDNWYATQVAYLAQKLNGLPGMNGGTVLDQSVICWSSELDMGAAHNHDDTPFLLVGGANGKLKTGQMVTFPLDFVDGDARMAAAKDRAHNDLLLTLAQVMGTPLTTFGEPTYCTGPITQILTP